jgi:hypothetical protein
MHETSEHNFILALGDKGQLKDFYADVFEFPRQARGSAREARGCPPSRALRRTPGEQPVLPVLQGPIRLRRRRGRAVRVVSVVLGVRIDPCGQ